MFDFYLNMQIKIREKQNIVPIKLDYQNNSNSRFVLNNLIKNDVFVKNNINFNGLNPDEILKPFAKFGISEYKKLTAKQIEALRSSLSEKLIKDRDAVITLSDIVKQNLEKMHPNGYVFVPIGRSAAVIGKALEYQGTDVKYCPMSNLARGFKRKKFKNLISELPTEKISIYKDYLDSINLSIDMIKESNKAYVITDFVNSGDTLKNFQILLSHPEINIYSKIQYLKV